MSLCFSMKAFWGYSRSKLRLSHLCYGSKISRMDFDKAPGERKQQNLTEQKMTAQTPKEGQNIHFLPRLETEYLWPVAILACVFAFVNTHPIRPQDFWWHLRLGYEIVRTGHIPQTDIFSYTQYGQAYPPFNIFWLADIVLYGIYAAGGPALNIFFQAVLITGTYGLLYALCRRLAAEAKIAAAATLGAMWLGIENWNVRPQALCFPLFVGTLWLIYKFRLDTKNSGWLLAGFPALTILWANSHGSFPLIFVLQGLWLIETLWKRWQIGPWAPRLWPPIVALALSGLALGLNPQGWGILQYLQLMGSHPVAHQGREWRPASLFSIDGIAFYILASMGFVLLLWAGRARSGLFHWLLLMPFSLLAWRTGRAIIWLGFVWAPIVAEIVPRLLPEASFFTKRNPRKQPTYMLPSACFSHKATLPPEKQGFPSPLGSSCSTRTDASVIVVLIFFAGMSVLSLPWLKAHLPLPPHKAGLVSAETPVRAVAFMRDHSLPPPLFHDGDFGSYLIWAAYPAYRVFVDTRIELYPLALWQSYAAISSGEAGWDFALRQWGVRTALLSLQRQAGLVAQMRIHPAWRLVYEDEVAIIFVREM